MIAGGISPSLSKRFSPYKSAITRFNTRARCSIALARKCHSSLPITNGKTSTSHGRSAPCGIAIDVVGDAVLLDGTADAFARGG